MASTTPATCIPMPDEGAEPSDATVVGPGAESASGTTAGATNEEELDERWNYIASLALKYWTPAGDQQSPPQRPRQHPGEDHLRRPRYLLDEPSSSSQAFQAFPREMPGASVSVDPGSAASDAWRIASSSSTAQPWAGDWRTYGAQGSSQPGRQGGGWDSWGAQWSGEGWHGGGWNSGAQGGGQGWQEGGWSSGSQGGGQGWNEGGWNSGAQGGGQGWQEGTDPNGYHRGYWSGATWQGHWQAASWGSRSDESYSESEDSSVSLGFGSVHSYVSSPGPPWTDQGGGGGYRHSAYTSW
ncbi:unnamed protein product [Symbiodinium sp. CCMP2456]|nr:unnamed protein product [Symbiodinium sp. CCMP2456]